MHTSGNLLILTFCDCTAAKIISPSPVLAIWPLAAEDDLLRGECELLGLWVLAQKHISQRKGRKSHNAEVRKGCYIEPISLGHLSTNLNNLEAQADLRQRAGDDRLEDAE